jgi:aryl-alcohol dehydrogenase-like predicted oxidoreductase
LAKTGVQISALGLGGHHLGSAKDEKIAIDIVHRALDGGSTFYDNAWEYYRGKTESWLGLGLKGRLDKAFVMTRVCTQGRYGSLAMQMLEQSLRRLQAGSADPKSHAGPVRVGGERPEDRDCPQLSAQCPGEQNCSG